VYSVSLLRATVRVPDTVSLLDVALPKARIGSQLVCVVHSVLVVPPAALTGLCCCVLRPSSLGSYLGPIRVMGSLRVHDTCPTCVHDCPSVRVMSILRVHVTCYVCTQVQISRGRVGLPSILQEREPSSPVCPGVRVMGSLRVWGYRLRCL